MSDVSVTTTVEPTVSARSFASAASYSNITVAVFSSPPADAGPFAGVLSPPSDPDAATASADADDD
eukprot:SAG25_NODE_2302_length_1740_cov_0.937843_3_plen_65_part_01